jgi:putative iron-regulated protein
MNKTKLWLGIGSFVLAGSAIASNSIEIANAGPQPSAKLAHERNPLMVPVAGTDASQGGESAEAPIKPAAAAEGGEGGAQGGEAGGGALDSYSLASTNPKDFQYDAAPQVDAYIDLVRSSYDLAAAGAQSVDKAVDALLADPNEATLAAARKAWVKARPSYLVTEAFRFYDGPIETVEARINAWPLNEAAIDYVKGDPEAGLVNAADGPLTLADIDAADQKKDEADVTTGWHAVEFLLWGQDFSAPGPGNRPASDYTPGTQANDRRRFYLHAVTEQLSSDISGLAIAWADADANGYVAKLKAMPPREVIGRMLNGMGILAGSEFMSARLAVGLDSGDQEDEHSCFSDTTHQDFIYDLAGVKAVWTGDGAGKKRAGLDELARAVDPQIAGQVDALFADAEIKVAALGDPWDQVLASPEGSPGRAAGEAAVAALQALTDGLVKAGAKLGVLVLIPAAG